MHAKFDFENLEGRNQMEDQDVDGRIIRICIINKLGWEILDWIDLAQNKF
jgi:hypothetical protein